MCRVIEMSIDYKVIGTNIRIERAKKGLKQYELAELAHISTQHMSHVEHGTAQISLPSLVEIANVLETSVDALLGINQTSNRRKILETQYGAMMEKASDNVVELSFALCRFLAEWPGFEDHRRIRQTGQRLEEGENADDRCTEPGNY